MKIINPSYKVWPLHGPSENEVLKHIEKAGRICYQSQSKPGSARHFVKRIKEMGHSSVLEMANIVLKGEDFYISASPRAFLEARHLSLEVKGALKESYPFLFEEFEQCPHPGIKVISQMDAPIGHIKVAVLFTVDRAFSHELVRHRLCSYLQESQRYCAYKGDIEFVRPPIEDCSVWKEAMLYAEKYYHQLLKLSPQMARKVLPNSTATHILCYTNMKQWKHILEQRTQAACDPSMYKVMRPLKVELHL